MINVKGLKSGTFMLVKRGRLLKDAMEMSSLVEVFKAAGTESVQFDAQAVTNAMNNLAGDKPVREAFDPKSY